MISRTVTCNKMASGHVSCLLLLVLCSWSPGSFSEPLSEDWQLYINYVKTYDKPYVNDLTELNHRFAVFQQSVARHDKLNSHEKANKGTAIYGVNKFSDLTPEEFRGRYLSPAKSVKSRNIIEVQEDPTQCKNISKTFDWRDHKVITAIKNQEHCGSCWAFSVVETLESAWAIINNHISPEPLSTQQLISCLYGDYGVNGCQGAVLDAAFTAVQNDPRPVVPDSVYPFSSGDGSSPPPSCIKLPNEGVNLTKYEYYQNMPECDMAKNLVQHTPLSTSADAMMWQDYISGIIQHHCTSSQIDHAVQVVGYNLNNDPIPYWIVRNTWGTDWGENGYLRVKFGDGTCGISEEIAWIDDIKAVNI